jgi:hypothetical protein
MHGSGPDGRRPGGPPFRTSKEAEMVLVHAGGYELLVPLVMLLGLLFIMRGGDPKRDGRPPVETGHRRGRADPENS